MTHITDMKKASHANDWKQSFPSLFSDVQRRDELIIALDTLEASRLSGNRARKALYDHLDGRN
jgi:hypothetical protein